MGARERERAENKNPAGGGDTCNARVGPTSYLIILYKLPGVENFCCWISGTGPRSFLSMMLSFSFWPVPPPMTVLSSWFWADCPRLCWRSVRRSLSSFCLSSRTIESHSCSFLLASQFKALTSSLKSLISSSKAEELSLDDEQLNKLFSVKLSRTRIVDLGSVPAD